MIKCKCYFKLLLCKCKSVTVRMSKKALCFNFTDFSRLAFIFIISYLILLLKLLSKELKMLDGCLVFLSDLHTVDH